MPDNITSTLKEGRYVYDVVLISPNDKRTRVIQGMVIVSTRSCSIMSDYIVTLDDSYEFDIRSESGLRDYNLGVNYEIPSKSTQYSNLKLDNISSQFNGTNKTFNLTINGDPYYPLNDQQLIISVGDVIQNPGIDYVISGNQIIFYKCSCRSYRVFWYSFSYYCRSYKNNQCSY